MGFEEMYYKLSFKDKEEFAFLANKLLSVNYILRDAYSKNNLGLKINYDYRFVERHYELFDEYFRFTGWDINKEDKYGVIYIRNIYEFNRLRVNKFTTIMLLMLRIIYEEEREKLSLKKEIMVTVGSVLSKMINLGILKKKPSDSDIRLAYRQLNNFNIIDKLEGDWKDAETKLIIYPSILFVITNQKLNELNEFIEQEIADEDEEAEDETI